MLGEACELEIAYARDTRPRGVLQIGLCPLFDEPENLPVDERGHGLRKEKNFFETRVVDHRTGGGLEWD
jgi:ribonucleoside-diphosphate reductase beta chain